MRWRIPEKLAVRVHALSDSVASGTLLPLRKQVCESLARDDTLVDLETDKVILEIPAPASGTLVELRQPEGAVVKADEVVAVIETGEAIVVPGPAEKPVQLATPAVAVPTVAAVPAPAMPLPVTTPAAASDTPGASRREPGARLRRRVAERLVAAQH